MSSRFVLLGLILSLSTGRWGAWIGFPSAGIFVLDIILLIALSLALLEHEISIPNITFYITLLFLVFQLFRNPNSAFLIRVRDLLPFIYFMIFYMLKSSIKNIPIISMMRGLRFASFFSLVWNTLVSIQLVKPFMIRPFTGIEIFSQRPDHAGVVAGIGCLVWGSARAFDAQAKLKIMRILFPYLFVFQSLLTTGRAGLIATILCFSYVVFVEKESRILNRKRLFFLALFLLGILFAPIAPQLIPENSSIARLGVFSPDGKAAQTGQGTALARRNASKLILDWTVENRLQFYGAGPGYEILKDSGAVRWLSGSLDVRYPHNWWVSLYSRYGLVGIVIWTSNIIWYWRKTSAIKPIKSLVIAATLFVASFGVIIESPFGLWPLYFFLFR